MTPNILYLTHRTPYPPDKGDRIRNWKVLQAVAGRARVWLAALADEPVPDETRRVLTETCAHFAAVPIGRERWLRAAVAAATGRSLSEGAFRSPGLRRVIREWTAQTRFQAAIVSTGSLVPYLRMPELKGVPAVVDLVDVDSQKWLDYAATARPPRSWLYTLEGRRLRRLEAGLPAWAKAVLLVSEAEVEVYRGFAAPGPVHAIRNGVDLEYFHPMPAAEEPACVFVGALDYRPNVDAACWFAEAVWPELHRRRPELKFRLVGRTPAPAVRALAAVPGIEVVGQVPDVRPWVASALMAVVPLRIARGVQNKVLEAMAMAKACVASPAALAGVRATPDRDVLAATEPAEWIAAIERLIDDPGLRRRLGAAARVFIEAEHTTERCMQPLAGLLGL